MTVRWLNRWWWHPSFWLCHSARHPSTCLSVTVRAYMSASLPDLLLLSLALFFPFLLFLFFSFFFCLCMSQWSKSRVCLLLSLNKIPSANVALEWLPEKNLSATCYVSFLHQLKLSVGLSRTWAPWSEKRAPVGATAQGLLTYTEREW